MPNICSCVPPITLRTLAQGELIKSVNADVMATPSSTYLIQHPLRYGADTSAGDESTF